MIVEEVDFLEHYGVKGMKWGERHAHSKAMRQLDKASLKGDRQKHAAEVDKARERFKSGKARQDYLKAKAKYKEDKNVVGKREARKALQKVKDQNVKDYYKAQEYKDGKEVAKGLLVVGGLTALSAALAAASATA